MSWIRTSAACISIFSLACTSGAQTAGEENAPLLYRGTFDCRRCHTPRAAEEDNDYILFNEGDIWLQQDFHSKAYSNLNGAWGQRIAKLMEVDDVLDPKSGCVQCHGIFAGSSQLDSKVDFGEAGTSDDLLALASEGVSCEMCHGASSEWSDRHRNHVKWQEETTPDEKRDLGWIDVRSPVERAEVCLSCHVGSFDQDRVITHKMYAAGHPPLSGFEIESFVNRMPAHWRYPYEKDEDKKTFDRTRNILIGSVVALRMSIELAMKDAQQDNMLDFARLDCYACHHDLADSQWRQLRDAHGVPGRPPLAVGSIPIVEVAATVLKGQDSVRQMDQLVEQLRAPFAAATLGNLSELARIGPAVVAVCQKLEQGLNQPNPPLEAEQALQVLHDLAQLGASEYVDFDTARQLIGAWIVVYQELVDNGAIDRNSDAKIRIDGLLRQMGKKDFFVLDQATGRAAEDKPNHESIDERVEILFRDRMNYNPVKFAAVMKQLEEWTRPLNAAHAR